MWFIIPSSKINKYMYICMYNFYLNKIFKFFIFLKEIIMIIKILFSNYMLSFGYHTEYL